MHDLYSAASSSPHMNFLCIGKNLLHALNAHSLSKFQCNSNYIHFRSDSTDPQYSEMSFDLLPSDLCMLKFDATA